MKYNPKCNTLPKTHVLIRASCSEIPRMTAILLCQLCSKMARTTNISAPGSSTFDKNRDLEISHQSQDHQTVNFYPTDDRRSILNIEKMILNAFFMQSRGTLLSLNSYLLSFVVFNDVSACIHSYGSMRGLYNIFRLRNLKS